MFGFRPVACFVLPQILQWVPINLFNAVLYIWHNRPKLFLTACNLDIILEAYMTLIITSSTKERISEISF